MHAMTTLTLSPKLQVLIPKPIREAMQLHHASFTLPPRWNAGACVATVLGTRIDQTLPTAGMALAISVWPKSSPLYNSGKPRTLASA